MSQRVNNKTDFSFRISPPRGESVPHVVRSCDIACVDSYFYFSWRRNNEELVFDDGSG
jgi:hypothetical protein